MLDFSLLSSIFFRSVLCCLFFVFCFFFFNDTATTEIYTLSLHDALPIYLWPDVGRRLRRCADHTRSRGRSEEHTSELQSRRDLVCRLLLEKKKTTNYPLVHQPPTHTSTHLSHRLVL